MKRIFSSAMIVVLCLSMLASLKPAFTGSPVLSGNDASKYDWPQFQGGSAHNGHSPSPGPTNNCSTWNYSLGGSKDSMVEYNGTLIVTEPDTPTNSGQTYGWFYGFNVTTGQKMWNGYTATTSMGDHISVGTFYPPVGNGLIMHEDYCMVCWYSEGPWLVMDNASNGNNVWTSGSNSAPTESPYYGYGLAAYYNGLFYFSLAGTPTINALFPNGASAWTRAFSGSQATLPTFGDGVMVEGFSDTQELSALNASNGTSLWNFPTNGTIVASPSFYKGTFFFGTSTGKAYAVSEKGVMLWQRQLGNLTIAATPTAAGSLVYFGTQDGTIYALNAATGTTQWMFNGGPFISSPVISNNDILYEDSEDGYIYAVSASGGNLLWKRLVGASPASSPVLYDGLLFVTDNIGEIHAFGTFVPPPREPIAVSITPSVATTSIGGSVIYDAEIGNYENVSDNFSLSLQGLNSSWYSLSQNYLVLALGQVAGVTLKVTPPENPNNAGTYRFSLVVSSTQSQMTVSASLIVLLEPIMSRLEPGENMSVGSTNVLFSWTTSSSASSEVFIKREGDTTFDNIVGASGTAHYVSVTGLSRNTIYLWYAYSKTTYGSVSSDTRTLSVSYGVSFTQRSYTFNVQRDYAQNASISVVNTDTTPHTVLLQANNTYNDIIVSFVGPGSVDENVTLQPGETLPIDFEVFAQDAMQRNYTFTVTLNTLGNESIFDYALVHVNVKQPNINLALVEDSTDPTTLSKTITATNYGDTITDLSIGTCNKLVGKVYLNPTVTHEDLPTGESLTFEVNPVLTTNFTSDQGYITATGDGQIIAALPVNFTLPAGKSVYSAVVPQMGIEFDKYYDTDDSPNTNPLSTQPVESYLANGTKIFASQIIVDVYQDGVPAYGANVSLTMWNSTGAVAALEYSMTDFTGKALFNVAGKAGSYSYQAQLVGYGLETEKRAFSVSTSYLYEIRPSDITWLEVSDGKSTYNLTESMRNVTLTQPPFTFKARTAITGENATFGLVLRWDLDPFKRLYILGSVQNGTFTFQTSGVPVGNFTAIVYYYSPDTGLSLSPAINVTSTDSTSMYIQGNYTYYTPFPFNSTYFIRLVTEHSVSNRDPAVAFDLINIEPASTNDSLYQLEYMISSNETVQKDFHFYVNTTEGVLYNTTFQLNLNAATPLEVNFTIPVELSNGTLQGEFDATLSTSSASVTTKTTPQLIYIYDTRIWVGSSNGLLPNIWDPMPAGSGLVPLLLTPWVQELLTCGAFTIAGLIPGVGTAIGGMKDSYDLVTGSDDIIDKQLVMIGEIGSVAEVTGVATVPGEIISGVASITQCLYDAYRIAGKTAEAGTGAGVCVGSKTSMWYCTNRQVVSTQIYFDPPSADVTEAAAVVQFSLPWPIETYRPHNVHLFINGVQIGELMDTIPDGYYIFPFNSSLLNYVPGELTMNTITMKIDNLNGGHYVVTANWEIILCIRQVTLSVVAANQSQANSLLQQMSGTVASLPEFAIYPEGTNCSNPQPLVGQNLTFSAKVFNFGTVGMSYVPVDLYVDSVKVGSAIISFLPALANQTVTFSWTATSGVHNVTIIVNEERTLPESDYSNNQAQMNLAVYTHDVAITNVTPTKTVVGQNSNEQVTLKIGNPGDFNESFNVTIYANSTIVASQIVALAEGASTTITLIWNTAGFAKGNYTIRARILLASGETNTANNTYTYGTVKVTIPGDVNGDRTVNVLDLISIATHLGHHATDYTTYSADWYKFTNCDLNSDGNINVLDLIICATHLGQHW